MDDNGSCVIASKQLIVGIHNTMHLVDHAPDMMVYCQMVDALRTPVSPRERPSRLQVLVSGHHLALLFLWCR